MVMKIDVSLEDVQQVYDGPVGKLWELLMGEEIHVGGVQETDILAGKAQIKKHSRVLDVCSALGGPARHLAQKFGCQVTGLDATKTMFNEAVTRTEAMNLSGQVDFKLGDALEMPFANESFDVVWGQDAWCYVTDKKRLVKECHRVLKPHGTIAFTDWLSTENTEDREQKDLLTFMVFPYMETLNGYHQLLEAVGFKILEKEDLSRDFAEHLFFYHELLKDLKGKIAEIYGSEMYRAAEQGVNLWGEAAKSRKVSRGRIIGTKTHPPVLYH